MDDRNLRHAASIKRCVAPGTRSPQSVTANFKQIINGARGSAKGHPMLTAPSAAADGWTPLAPACGAVAAEFSRSRRYPVLGCLRYRRVWPVSVVSMPDDRAAAGSG